MNFLVASLVLSVVLTILLNVGVRAFPNVGERGARRMDEWMRAQGSPDGGRRSHVRVYAPWKAMLIASVVLTVVLNLVLRLAS